MTYQIVETGVRNMTSQQTPVGANEQTIASGLSAGSYVPLDTAPNVIDDAGYITTAPLDYYGPIPAGRAVVLAAAGVWCFELVAYWDTNTTGVRMATLTNVDARIEVAGQGLDTWLGDPDYAGWVDGPTQLSASTLVDKTTYRAHVVTGTIRTQPTYGDSRWAFYVAQDSGAPRTLKGWNMQMLWLGAGS